MQEFVFALEELIDESGKDERVKIIFTSDILLDDTFGQLIAEDAQWALAAVAFVSGYLVVYLGSLFLASVAVLLAILSFPMTALVTEAVLGVEYFGRLHLLCIVLVLSVAVCDIFVVVDAWRQSERIAPTILKKDDRHGRMAYTFRRALRAIAFSSSTTAATFFANVMSAIMPVRSFGIFAGVIVLVNYLQVVFIFPSAIIIYEDHLHRRCSCRRKIHVERELLGEVAADGRPLTQLRYTKDKIDPDKVDMSVWERLEIFLATKFNYAISKVRFLVILFFMGWFAAVLYVAPALGPLTRPEVFTAADNQALKPFKLQDEVFRSLSEQ